MKVSIASILRKIASMIEVDDTPTEEEIESHRMQPGVSEEGKVPSVHTRVQIEKAKPVAPSKIKRPRRLHEHQKKWNEEDKTGLMKEYMQNYRAEGKVYETDSPKSKYVKKPKV